MFNNPSHPLTLFSPRSRLHGSPIQEDMSYNDIAPHIITISYSNHEQIKMKKLIIGSWKNLEGETSDMPKFQLATLNTVVCRRKGTHTHTHIIPSTQQQHISA